MLLCVAGEVIGVRWGSCALCLLVLFGLLLFSPALGQERSVVAREIERIEGAAGQKCAVLVGIDAYQNPGLGKLKYAAQDVRLLYQVLTDPASGAFPEKNVRLMVPGRGGGDEPTRENILARCRFWLGQAREADTVLFYFSGHGKEAAGEQYLLALNTNPDMLEDTAVLLRRVVELLEASKAARRVLILDACRTDVEDLAQRGAEKWSAGLAESLTAAKGTLVLTSCGPGQSSYESAEYKQGVFSYHLRQGLLGQADGAAGGAQDGLVTATELSGYVWESVRRWAAQKSVAQEPYRRFTGVGEIVLGQVPPQVVTGEAVTPGEVEVVEGLEPGILEARCDVAGAEVRLDGALVGLTGAEPLKVRVPALSTQAQAHTVEVRKQGYTSWRGAFELAPGRSALAEVTLERLQAILEIQSQPPGATIAVNGNQVGKTPLTYSLNSATLQPQRYELLLTLEGYEPWLAVTEVKLGDRKVVQATLARATAPLAAGQVPSAGSGQVRINPKDGAEMAWIPAGEFTMGADQEQIDALWQRMGWPAGWKQSDQDESPAHKVYLDGFWIYRYEVTNEQYAKFVSATGRSAPSHWSGGRIPSGLEKHPMWNVSWEDAKAYCEWAGVRLPTEAEWEKAARGTDGRVWPWGNEWDPKKCNAYGRADGFYYTAPVGSFPQGVSPYGVMDMAGNVWEWCADYYDDDYYAQSPARNPTGPTSGSERALRGGSWCVNPGYTRTADRGRYFPAYGGIVCIGLRAASKSSA
jgi:iron(II)-dependent oxidoreductase